LQFAKPENFVYICVKGVYSPYIGALSHDDPRMKIVLIMSDL